MSRSRPANEGRHTPITRQRSEWIERPGIPSPVPGTDAAWFSRNVHDGTLWACVAVEPEIGWHVSISFRNHRGDPTRYPTWDEQVHALRSVGPRVPFAMHLPLDDDGYVAVHPSTFHWHQDHTVADRAELKRLRRECEHLRQACAAWMNGVADAVEPLGYDREAACGPADLLPGLLTLVELSRAHYDGPCDPPAKKRRATRLSVDQVRAVDQFAELLFVMFPHMMGVVHCGSSVTSDEWRDVDVRIVMENNQVHVLRAIVELDDLHMLLSRWGQQVTGLPIDCQVQERTEHERLSYTEAGEARGRWRGAGSLGTNARRIRDAGWFDIDESEAGTDDSEVTP